MKRIAAAVLVLLQVSLAQASWTDNYSSEVRYGMAILDRAAQNSTEYPNVVELFRRLAIKIRDAEVLAPPAGKDYKHCTREGDTYVMAYVVRGTYPNTIFTCDIMKNSDSKEVAQILIHEGAHLLGLGNECDATKVEVGAMLLSGEGLAFRNSYMKECGIDALRRAVPNAEIDLIPDYGTTRKY